MGYMAEDVQDQKVELNNDEIKKEEIKINENTEKEKHLEKKIIPSNESNKFSKNNYNVN